MNEEGFKTQNLPNAQLVLLAGAGATIPPASWCCTKSSSTRTASCSAPPSATPSARSASRAWCRSATSCRAQACALVDGAVHEFVAYSVNSPPGFSFLGHAETPAWSARLPGHRRHAHPAEQHHAGALGEGRGRPGLGLRRRPLAAEGPRAGAGLGRGLRDPHHGRGRQRCLDPFCVTVGVYPCYREMEVCAVGDPANVSRSI